MPPPPTLPLPFSDADVDVDTDTDEDEDGDGDGDAAERCCSEGSSSREVNIVGTAEIPNPVGSPPRPFLSSPAQSRPV